MAPADDVAVIHLVWHGAGRAAFVRFLDSYRRHRAGRAHTLVLVFKVLTFLGALAIIPLFLLQAIVLKAFCSYCLATEVLMLAIWVLSFLLTAPRLSAEPLEAGAGAE